MTDKGDDKSMIYVLRIQDAYFKREKNNGT